MIFEPKKTTRIHVSVRVEVAAISPDGKYVTYVQEENGERQSLWTKHIPSESAVQIAPPADIQYRGLNVSPDGNQLYYVLAEGSLYQMPILGGAVKKIADGLYTGSVGQIDIGISPDGKQIAFMRGFGKESSALFIVNADGTDELRLATFERPIELGSSVAWSPDGEIIACCAVINGLQNILAVRVAEGISWSMLRHQNWGSILQMAWMPDSKSLLINTSGGRIYQIFSGFAAQQLAIEPKYYNGLGLTSDGRFLATVKAEQVAHIWMMPSNDASRARQLTAGFEKSDGVYQLNWIPDNKIVFDSYPNNKISTWVINATGGNSKQIAKDGESGTISPDGRFIVYQKYDLGLWRMDVSDGREEQLTKGSVDYGATFSLDGKWIVFNRFDERLGLWKVPLEGGEPTRVLDENAICPSVSPDGKMVAFVLWQASEANRIALVSFDGGEIIKTFDAKQERNSLTDNQHLQWTSDGRGIYFIALNDGISNIWRQPIDGGQPAQVTNFTIGRIFNFAFSSDGSRLALSRGTLNSDVVLIENAK